MNSRWSSRAVLIVPLVLGTAFSARAREMSELLPAGPPRLNAKLPESLADCLRDPENPQGHLQRNARWESSCPLPELFKKARRISKKDPALRLIMGDLIYWELERIQKPVVATAPEPQLRPLESDPDPTVLKSGDGASLPPTTVPELLHWTYFLRRNADPNGSGTRPEESVPPAQAAPTSSAQSPSDPGALELVKEAQFWLEPLFETKSAILGVEGAHKMLGVLAAAKRFDETRAFLEKHKSLLFGKRSLEERIVRDVAAWHEASQNALLGEWLLKKVEDLRPREITGQRRSDLFYWLKSLELGAAPRDAAGKRQLLETVRRLTIAYPGREEQDRIRDVMKRAGWEEEFKPITMREMNFHELMLHARSQVRELDTLGALRTMRRIRRIDDKLSRDQLWEAMEYHIRVLRILDERPQIPSVMKYYVAKGKFLEAPTKPTELSKYMTRAHELAKYFWTYDDPKKAEDVLDGLVAINQKYKTEYLMGPVLVIKSRIKEQAREPATAIPLMDEALKYRLPEDLRTDLMWRKIFLRLDEQATAKDYKSVLPLFEPLKKVSQKDPVDLGRWHYWHARVLQLAGEKDQATEEFRKAYDSDSYSFYSNLGGIELIKLGQKPKRWRLIDKEDAELFEDRRWSTPNWALYFKDTGEPLHAHFKDLARVYFLSQAGDWESARDAFGDLDRSLWARLFKRNISWSSRRDFMRAVTWTRLALQDPMGGLRAAEIARQANGKEFDKADLLSLYPLPYWSEIQAEASKRKVSPWLVASLIRQESAFNSKARSWANALGLMQMIPPVAKEEAKLMKIEKFENEDLYEPGLALQLGTHHLARLIDRFGGSYICSVASYNAGWPPVAKWLRYYPSDVTLSFVERIPYRETQNYVKSILRNFMNYQRIYKQGNFDIDLITKMPETPLTTTQPSAGGPESSNPASANTSAPES